MTTYILISSNKIYSIRNEEVLEKKKTEYIGYTLSIQRWTSQLSSKITIILSPHLGGGVNGMDRNENNNLRILFPSFVWEF